MPHRKVEWRAAVRRWSNHRHERDVSADAQDWHAMDRSESSQKLAFAELQRDHPRVLEVFNAHDKVEATLSDFEMLFCNGEPDSVLEEKIKDVELELMRLRSALSRLKE